MTFVKIYNQHLEATPVYEYHYELCYSTNLNITITFCLQLIQKLSIPWRTVENVPFHSTPHLLTRDPGQTLSETFI